MHTLINNESSFAKKKKNQTIIDVKFDKEFKSEFRIGLTFKHKPGNRKNMPNNDGKLRKIEEKRLPQLSNPQYLSAKFYIQEYM